MTAGLPGTGIGGIFYLLLACYMPISELFKTLRGETSLRRWSGVALQLSFVAGICLIMWTEIWLLNHVCLWIGEQFHIASLYNDGKLLFTSTGKMAYVSVMASFFSLALVVVAVSVLRIIFGRSEKTVLIPQANCPVA